MRIRNVEAIAVDIPLNRNFGGSTYSVLKRCTVVTRVHTDEGLASEVYNGDNRAHGREIVRLIHEQLAPRVAGLDILEVERSIGVATGFKRDALAAGALLVNFPGINTLSRRTGTEDLLFKIRKNLFETLTFVARKPA